MSSEQRNGITIWRNYTPLFQSSQMTTLLKTSIGIMLLEEIGPGIENFTSSRIGSWFTVNKTMY